MFSFNNYKEQCYNPGSPSPSPLRPPLQTFPQVNQSDSLISTFEFSPNSEPITPIKVRINTRQAKRKGKEQLEDVLLKTPTKKPKTMKEEELRSFFANISRFHINPLCTIT